MHITRRKQKNTYNPKFKLTQSFIMRDDNQLFCHFDRDDLFAFHRFG